MTAPRPTPRQRTKPDRSAGRRQGDEPRPAAVCRTLPDRSEPHEADESPPRSQRTDRSRPRPGTVAEYGNVREKVEKLRMRRPLRSFPPGRNTARPFSGPHATTNRTGRLPMREERHRHRRGGEAEGGKDASQTAKLRTGIGPTRKAGVRIAQGTYPNAAGIHGHFTPTAGGVGSVARKHHAPLHHGADFASARTEGQVMRCTADLACGTPFRSGLAGERPRRHGQRPADSHAGPPIRTESVSATANRRFTQARTGLSAEPGTGRNAPSKNGTRRRSEKQTTDTSETRPYDDAL